MAIGMGRAAGGAWSPSRLPIERLLGVGELVHIDRGTHVGAGIMPTTTHLPPFLVASKAWAMVSPVPMASRVNSAHPATGQVLYGLHDIAVTGEDDIGGTKGQRVVQLQLMLIDRDTARRTACFAPCTMFKPMPPQPMTATVEP